MKVSDYFFPDYYHKYITIEADFLTEKLKKEIKVHEDDCYALCSSYLDEEGYLNFNVLSIGPSWAECTRGLKKKSMLGSFGIDEVYNLEARIAEADMDMKKKNDPFLKKMDMIFDEDLLKTRLDARLDYVRDIYFPDVVMTGLINDRSMTEYAMRITGIKGPFLAGILQQEPEEDIGVHIDDHLYVLPYVKDGEIRLFALFTGENTDAEDEDAMERIIQETAEMGLDFNGITLRS